MGGSAGSHSVAKSGRDYFNTHNEQLFERNEVSARGKYMGDFQERDHSERVELEVVRPDTPPTPGGPESTTNLELRAPTPPTPGTPVVWDPCESLPGSPNDVFSPPTPGRGVGGDPAQSPCLSPSLSPTQVEDSPPTPGRTVTEVNWVAQTVHELQANDPDMAAFVVECDERDKRYTQAPHAPPHQGDVTQRDKRVSIQSKGIKNTFPCLWLPVSFCVASRVHSLLSACPAPNNIDSSV